MSKTLVAYFSASGITAEIAKEIALITNGDLFEIKPKIPYTTEDLDWTDKNSRTTIEMQDENSRPEIAENLNNIENYDTVFLGFPIWWYVAPTIINNFLESYDFSGKKIILFATSGLCFVSHADILQVELQNFCCFFLVRNFSSWML